MKKFGRFYNNANAVIHLHATYLTSLTLSPLLLSHVNNFVMIEEHYLGIIDYIKFSYNVPYGDVSSNCTKCPKWTLTITCSPKCYIITHKKTTG